VWDLETSRMKSQWPALGGSVTGKEGEKIKKPENNTENCTVLINLNYSVA